MVSYRDHLDNLLRYSLVVDLTHDEDPTDKDGDTRMGDSTGVSVSLGEIDSEDKRSLVKSSEESGEMFPGVTGE
ncbi:hypothetical protein Tco_1349736 [Tanacetum coccineum]